MDLFTYSLAVVFYNFYVAVHWGSGWVGGSSLNSDLFFFVSFFEVFCRCLKRCVGGGLEGVYLIQCFPGFMDFFK